MSWKRSDMVVERGVMHILTGLAVRSTIRRSIGIAVDMAIAVRGSFRFAGRAHFNPVKEESRLR